MLADETGRDYTHPTAPSLRPLQQSHSCLCAHGLWELHGSLSFPTVSTCLEVTAYDLQGNPVPRFYCPEKEMGMINQGEDADPSPPRDPPAPAEAQLSAGYLQRSRVP